MLEISLSRRQHLSNRSAMTQSQPSSRPRQFLLCWMAQVCSFSAKKHSGQATQPLRTYRVTPPPHTHTTHTLLLSKGMLPPPRSPSPTPRISPLPPPQWSTTIPSPPIIIFDPQLTLLPLSLTSPSHTHHQQGMPPLFFSRSQGEEEDEEARAFMREQSTRETKNERALN